MATSTTTQPLDDVGERGELHCQLQQLPQVLPVH
jgi:hypothetical protein